jgi:hypothetical protein
LNLFSQGKVIDRNFVNKGSVIQVYKTNDQNSGFEHILNLPGLKNSAQEKILPCKMFLQEQDCKIVLSESNKIFYFDLTKGKIEHELTFESQIRDACLYEKESNFTSRKDFFGIQFLSLTNSSDYCDSDLPYRPIQKNLDHG